MQIQKPQNLNLSSLLLNRKVGLPYLKRRDPFVQLSGLKVMSSIRSFPRKRNKRRNDFLKSWRDLTYWFFL
jgi:hypothetical protein